MELITALLNDLKPYENNPRINTEAIEPVMKSIMQVGYVTPIIIDENMVVLAGHTRYEAVKRLGFNAVDCIVVNDMTDEQKRKFRILDNKVAEKAEWDEELLKEELEGLNLGGIHWFDDLLNPAVAEMVEESTKKEQKQVSDDGKIICPRCGAEVPEMPFLVDDDEEVEW